MQPFFRSQFQPALNPYRSFVDPLKNTYTTHIECLRTLLNNPFQSTKSTNPESRTRGEPALQGTLNGTFQNTQNPSSLHLYKADYDKKLKESQSQENVVVRWDVGCGLSSWKYP